MNENMMACRGCGRELHVSARSCPQCGAVPLPQGGYNHKKILPAAILCFFFGCFGIHRFYVGKVGTGLLQIITFGGIGIWALIDLVMIVTGSFTDKNGSRITEWT